MNTRPPLMDDAGEVRELTAADMRLFRPAREALPVALQEKLGMRPHGHQVAPGPAVPAPLPLGATAHQPLPRDGW